MHSLWPSNSSSRYLPSRNNWILCKCSIVEWTDECSVFMQCNTTQQWEWMNHNYTQWYGWIILHHDEQKNQRQKNSYCMIPFERVQKQTKIVYSVRKEDSGCLWSVCVCVCTKESNISFFFPLSLSLFKIYSLGFFTYKLMPSMNRGGLTHFLFDFMS